MFGPRTWNVTFETMDGIRMEDEVPWPSDSPDGRPPMMIARQCFQPFKAARPVDKIEYVEPEIRNYAFSHQEGGRLVFQETKDASEWPVFRWPDRSDYYRRDYLLVRISRDEVFNRIAITFGTMFRGKRLELRLRLGDGAHLMRSSYFGNLAQSFKELGVPLDKNNEIVFGRHEGR